MKITAWVAGFFLPLSLAQPAIDQTRPAVVLVHGIYDDSHKMAWLAAQFATCGYETFTPSLSPADGSRSLPDLSRQLDEKLRVRFPAKRELHIIGFSMGGLIARHWLQNHTDLQRVCSFTTISSPHHGTAMAWLSVKAGVRDMRFGSPFLKDLAAHDDRLASLHPLSVYTPLDLVIIPSSSSVWPAASAEKFWLPAHPLMVYNRRVFLCILGTLTRREQPPPVQPPVKRV